MGISLYEVLPTQQDLKMLMVHPLRVQVSEFDFYCFCNAFNFCGRIVESRSMEVLTSLNGFCMGGFMIDLL